MYFVNKGGLLRTPEISLFLSFPTVCKGSDITCWVIGANNNNFYWSIFYVPSQVCAFAYYYI